MATGEKTLETAGAAGWRRMFVEVPRPRAIANHPSAAWFVVATVCMGAFMGQLDASIVSLAYPTSRGFPRALGDGRLGRPERTSSRSSLLSLRRPASPTFGRKLIYLYGFAGVRRRLGALWRSLQPSRARGFRVLQAMGAAMLQANSVASSRSRSPRALARSCHRHPGRGPGDRARRGPAVGGPLLAAGGWRLLFLVNVPFGIVGVVAGIVVHPLQPRFGRTGAIRLVRLGLVRACDSRAHRSTCHLGTTSGGLRPCCLPRTLLAHSCS